jgi:hypothetical protein
VSQVWSAYLQQDGNILADSIIVGVSNRMLFRLHYEITCDSNWKVKELDLMLLSGNRKSIKILEWPSTIFLNYGIDFMHQIACLCQNSNNVLIMSYFVTTQLMVFTIFQPFLTYLVTAN